MKQMTVTLAALGALLVCGCNDFPGPEDNPSTLTDTAGHVFTWDCDETSCSLDLGNMQIPVPGCREGTSAGIVTLWGRLFSFCTACIDDDGSGASWSSGACRPVACKQDTDCPQVFWYMGRGYAEYECRKGLCQNINTELHPPQQLDDDLVEDLCYASVPRHQTVNWDSPTSKSINSKINSHCPSSGKQSCTLPASCWQPY